jgi:pyruvate carboxylase
MPKFKTSKIMNSELRKLDKILVANRGEIAIRVLRAASELKIKTVAIYTYEDRYSLHRYKADEAYQIGKDDEPLKPYLDIERIISLAKDHDVDAIHPGYGFLSENVSFARRCKEEGIIFVGPEPEVMESLGDKVAAKRIALQAKVPVIQDSKDNLEDFDAALKEAQRIGFPIMIKAAAGGGGRGMRIVKKEDELKRTLADAKAEAKKAFGDDTVFLEKYIDNPKHIEVQLMGDNYGNIVHLYERDCSVQRRFQKVVEVAPSMLHEETKKKIYDYALSIARVVNYNNVGTVEFLVDINENIFFIEVNPRIQVEHTITEEITNIDIVRSQILIAKGHRLSDPCIFITKQEDIKTNGFAIQCRITTEDPSNGFKPDYGTIIAYRNAGGFGIRLDEGSSYPGVKISPFFDSMLVKVSSSGRTLRGACERLHRTLREFRIRGVKTNIGFLENVISHPTFTKGDARVKFIEDHPELFEIARRGDRGTKNLLYLANVIVNGNPDVKNPDPKKTFRVPVVPDFDKFGPYPSGTKQILENQGRDGLIQWLKENKKIQYTDTTFRDAHQSLLATRVRTKDMERVAESFAKNHPEVFSMEVWGGATFDVALRFLHECPWKRLQILREKIPNVLFQMLIRGSNAIGYKAYPDNLIEVFIEKAWDNGIDIFRIFDSLNWVEAMKVSIKAVRERTGGIAEAAISYTGDLLSADNKKYTLSYYLDMARQFEDAGAHILCIKDMAGLLKPYSAQLLITELKKAVDMPIHLHTHDTSSIQAATYLKAIEAGVDIIDVAIGSMSGLTSQPNFNSILAMMEGHEREQKLNIQALNAYSNYWEDVREFYYPFESGLKAGTAEVYTHEIPGGQYSNLRPQAESLGLGLQFEEIKKNYSAVNELFGDIVKVTPSSKVVGDMALFMTSNNLTPQDVMERGNTLSFPESVISFFKGELGQPYGGFPEQLQKIVLKGEKAFTDRPNEHLQPIDFEKDFKEFQSKFGDYYTFLDYLSYKMYPKVFESYHLHNEQFGEVSNIPTLAFFYGLKNNEEVLIKIASGKTIIVKKLYVSEADDIGMRTVAFELNGQSRRVQIKDNQAVAVKPMHRKASRGKDIGSPLLGRLANIFVKPGDIVNLNTPLFVIEAMKMETTITSNVEGKIKSVCLAEGVMVEQDDLIVEIE